MNVINEVITVQNYIPYNTSELIVTDLMLKRLSLAVRPETRLLTFEGPARSLKTTLAIQIFYYLVYESNEMRHVIAGKDFDTIRINILEAKGVGLLTTHPNIEMLKGKIGGYYLKMYSPNGIKEILLCGYDDASKWKKILGGTLGVVYVDESNIANPNFIKETFARQLSADNPKTLFTLNGDNPDHYIYQEYINFGKIVGDVPASTKALMQTFQQKNGVKKGYYYCHFKMSDNPIMTPEKLARAQTIYPIGSYYFKTKILGERGVQGDLIFNEYMDPNKLIIDAYEKDERGLPKYKITDYTIGADIGANKAYNVFVLIGWLKDYKKCIILKYQSFQKVGYDTKTQKLREFIKICVASGVNLRLCDGIAVDSAEQNYITDLKPKFINEFNLDVFGSWKATIKDRIDMNIVGFSTARVLFHKDCMPIYKAYETSTWAEGQIGKERLDSGIEANDLMDATEYAQTRRMKELMREGE